MNALKHIQGLGGYILLTALLISNDAISQLQPKLTWPENPVDSFHFSCNEHFLEVNGKYIATENPSGLLIRNIATGNIVKMYDDYHINDDNADWITFLRSKEIACTLSYDGDSVDFWDINTGKVKYAIKGSGYIRSSPNENLILTTGENSSADSISIFDRNTGKLIYSLFGSKGEFSEDGKWIFISSYDTSTIYFVDTLKIYNINNGILKYNIKGSNGYTSPSGKWILTTYVIDDDWPLEKNRVNIYEASTGSLKYSLWASCGEVRIEWIDDNKFLIVEKFNDQKVLLCDFSLGKLIDMGNQDFSEKPITFEFSPDNKWFIINQRVSESKGIYKFSIWNLKNLTLIKNNTFHSDSRPESIVFSPDGKLFSIPVKNSSVRTWESSTGKLLFTIPVKVLDDSCSEYLLYKRKGYFPYKLEFSLDSKYLIMDIGCSSIGIWESGTGKLKYKLNSGEKSISPHYFSLEKDRIITESDSTRIWEMETGKLIGSIAGVLYKPYLHLPLILVNGNPMSSLVNINTGRILISWAYIDSCDWVVTLPSGLFDASTGALKKLYYVQDNKKIELDSLKDKYYVPGLWEKVMSGKPLRAVEN